MPKVKKTRNNNTWTEARFKGFIKSALRSASLKWGPKNEVKKSARVDRGKYICAICKCVVPATILENGKRKPNVFVDHINPVIDPAVGFVSWDVFIERLFCDSKGLQLLCKD